MSIESYEDYVSVKIIGMTESFIKDTVTGQKLTPQEFVAYCARVSNPGNQMNNDTSENLLLYCIRNKHWSIFEMVNIVCEIKTTRDISHQAIRHNSNKFQEFSQRYADPTQLDSGFVVREARLQDKKNRQNSFDTDDDKLKQEWIARQLQQIDLAKENYDWAIAQGIAKEQARVVLPEGLTKTTFYINGNLRSFIHYIQVRADPSTQKEHRIIANALLQTLQEYFPFLNRV